jgi:hypothetical protein
MKFLKTIAATCVAFALISAVSAQTVIHITGSTAYRAAVYWAINDILAPGYTFGYSGNNGILKASQAIFTGTTATGGISVIIKTSFSGSVGGISTLAANLTIGPGGSFTGGGGWLVNTTPQAGVGAGGFPNGGTGNAAANYDTATTADVSMADVFQASAPSIYRTPKLADHFVGVVPFVYVATKGGTAIHGSVTTSTSIASEQVKDIFVEGSIKLSELSGSSLDTESVLGVGRDEDSGTRIQALATAGINVSTFLKQNQPLFNGNTTPTNPPPPPGTSITGAALWPALTLNAIAYPQGDSGYSSGGSLAAAINVPHAASYSTWFVSYLGINDAASVTNGIQLEFNGVPYSAANVEGPGATGFKAQYGYWGYEHLFYRTTFTGNGKTVADQVSADLNNPASHSANVSGIPISSMKVSRDSDGGAIETGGNPGT